jgi:hypothetical protein
MVACLIDRSHAEEEVVFREARERCIGHVADRNDVRPIRIGRLIGSA